MKKKFKILAILLGILSSVMWVAFSKIMENVINIILDNRFNSFIYVVLFFVIYILFTRLLFWLAKYFKMVYINESIRNLKNCFLEKQYEKNRIDGSSDILSVITNDMNIIKQYYYANKITIICDLTTFILSSYLMLRISVSITLALYILIVSMVILPFVFKRKLEKIQNELVNRNREYVNLIKDQFSGFNVLKDFAVIDYFKNKQSKANYFLTKSYIQFENVNAIFEELSHFIITIIGSIGFLLGAYYVLLGKVNYGEMIALVQLSNTLTSPVSSLMSNVAGYISAKKLYTNITQVINNKNYKSQNINLNASSINNICFEDVSLRLDNKQILNHVNLNFKKGKKYLILGETGSGKSSLLKLIMNYYQNYQGVILINDSNVKNIDILQLSQYINYSAQDKYLFIESIRNNISLFRKGERTVENLIKMVQLDKLIQKKNTSLDMIINENQDNISGGEKERICLCRALFVPKKVFLADEITSSLDFKTSQKIENILINLDVDILINVTHKISEDNLKFYDEIIVMKNGSVDFVGNSTNYYTYKRLH